MRKGLRVVGAMALSLAAPYFAAAQSTIIIPPPGTPVAPLEIPAHVAPPITEHSDKPAGRKIINTTRAQIDYRIDTVGASGIGKVEIYATPDRGMTWVKIGEDADKQSPAHVDLPGEGLFGIRIVITNGNGFGGRGPKAGDRPQLFVEVDAASPRVSLQPHAMVPNLAAIDLRWSATDANLAAEPIGIFYRTQLQSEWRPIAQNIKNDGTYRWMLPPDIGGQVFLKLEVVDLAGNLTRIETPMPLLLDQAEPEATIIDANPIQRETGPGNNIIPVSGPQTTMPVLPPALPPVGIPPSVPASMPSLPN